MTHFQEKPRYYALAQVLFVKHDTMTPNRYQKEGQLPYRVGIKVKDIKIVPADSPLATDHQIRLLGEWWNTYEKWSEKLITGEVYEFTFTLKPKNDKSGYWVTVEDAIGKGIEAPNAGLPDPTGLMEEEPEVDEPMPTLPGDVPSPAPAPSSPVPTERDLQIARSVAVKMICDAVKDAKLLMLCTAFGAVYDQYKVEQSSLNVAEKIVAYILTGRIKEKGA